MALMVVRYAVSTLYFLLLSCVQFLLHAAGDSGILSDALRQVLLKFGGGSS